MKLRALLPSTLVLVACNALAAERAASWAQPVDLAGAPNLHRVTPTLYRSAQPSAEGMKNLEILGVRTVLSLRSFHSDAKEAKGTKLALERVRFDTWDVDEDEIIEALRFINDPANQPVLVHCKHGADRTGMIIALQRIIVEGWPKDEAIKEMKSGGYGYHEVWTHIPRYLEKADVETLRAAMAESK